MAEKDPIEHYMISRPPSRTGTARLLLIDGSETSMPAKSVCCHRARFAHTKGLREYPSDIMPFPWFASQENRSFSGRLVFPVTHIKEMAGCLKDTHVSPSCEQTEHDSDKRTSLACLSLTHQSTINGPSRFSRGPTYHIMFDRVLSFSRVKKKRQKKREI